MGFDDVYGSHGSGLLELYETVVGPVPYGRVCTDADLRAEIRSRLAPRVDPERTGRYRWDGQDWEELDGAAASLFRNNPDWTLTHLAKELDVGRQRLYDERLRAFKAVREQIETESGERRDRHRPPPPRNKGGPVRPTDTVSE